MQCVQTNKQEQECNMFSTPWRSARTLWKCPNCQNATRFQVSHINLTSLMPIRELRPFLGQFSRKWQS